MEAEGQSQNTIKRISRKAMQGFNMIPYHLENEDSEEEAIILNRRNGNYNSKDATLCYTLPIHGYGAPNNKLFLTQRVNNVADISDLEFCNKHDIDNTGLVCQWPSEDVLAYFCLSHADLFRSKRVIEVGSGYGLAGLVIAAVTDATEVIISDGSHNLTLNGSICTIAALTPMNTVTTEATYSLTKATLSLKAIHDKPFQPSWYQPTPEPQPRLIRPRRPGGTTVEDLDEKIQNTSVHDQSSKTNLCQNCHFALSLQKVMLWVRKLTASENI
ncbi:hypothetical protein F8388_015432 [Cannabis sativa]|uniref:Calmodulin-lysine N-methyltransferase n=1 Tax=Cannabis sativa TaxID=3483 RepID=A0A7J6GI42_CANSA|nr:hypothetical protein F8388_015432 [Cannabis sativa]